MSLRETQIFTPPHTTNQMLDLLGDDVFKEENTYFFEPTCGDGQMLEVIVERIYKNLLAKYNEDKEKTLADTCFKFYAIEIDPVLVPKARTRIFNFIFSKIDNSFNVEQFLQYLVARLLHEKIECKDFFEHMKLWNKTQAQ